MPYFLWSPFSKRLDPNISTPSLSLNIASTIYNRISPADIIHILAKPNVKLDYIIKMLHSAMDLPPSVQPRGPWLREFSGICLEMYRTKAKHAQGQLMEELNGMWQTAHDMCSLSAYYAAFSDCKEGDIYDPSKPLSTRNSPVVHSCALPLAAVWPLIGLTTWILEFLERLMKECVLFGQRPADAEGIEMDGDDDDDDLFGSAPCE